MSPRNFYTDVIMKDPRYTFTGDVRDVMLLEPVTRAAVANIIADAAKMGITLRVTETYRSNQRQAELFAEHLTELRQTGVHHWGCAADVCKIINGEASWAGDWTFLGTLAQRFGLVWGGNWGLPNEEHSFRDWDHVQRVSVVDQGKLFSGSWYPDESYNPYA